MRPSLPRLVHAYGELLMVLVAAAVGLTVQGPLGWLVRHHGIDVLLVILVLSTALTIDPGSLRGLRQSWHPLVAALGAGLAVLPALSWLAGHLVTAGPLRDGVITLGLAPCEIASIATTSMAGGDAVLAGGVLITSTLLTVALAGPVLSLEVHGAGLHPWPLVVNLLSIVAIPLGVGVGLRAKVRLPEMVITASSSVSAVSVALLVALVAAEVHFIAEYVHVLGAILLFLAASIVVGRLVGGRAAPTARRAVLLTVSMRDFAIAAGVATAAFGLAAAAPLGMYGVLVLVWGTGSAGFMRSRA